MPKRVRQEKRTSKKPVDHEPRIIGGRFRGHKLLYHGDRRTRPMKQRVREAVFNLLGPGVADKHAIDLFAGTGALGLEAISRGAKSATFVERHFPTADLIERNVAAIGAAGKCEIVAGDTFIWARRPLDLPECPWLILSSPPYDFYVDRCDAMLELLQKLCQLAPTGSLAVVEADERFDFRRLPLADLWEVRSYPPAVIGIATIE